MHVAMNYLTIAASVLLITIFGAWAKVVIVELHLASSDGIYKTTLEGLNPIEKKALTWARVGFGVVIVGILLLILPNNAPLWPEGTEFLVSPFMEGLVPVIVLMFFVAGLIFGSITKEIRNDRDVADQLAKTMGNMGLFIVLAFTAGQFVAYFSESNMGLVLGVYGAEFLQSINLTGIPL